jgi:hypothetical protein
VVPGRRSTVQDGRERVVIENVLPQVEEGRYPIKRVIGESVTVSGRHLL